MLNSIEDSGQRSCEAVLWELNLGLLLN